MTIQYRRYHRWVTAMDNYRHTITCPDCNGDGQILKNMIGFRGTGWIETCGLCLGEGVAQIVSCVAPPYRRGQTLDEYYIIGVVPYATEIET